MTQPEKKVIIIGAGIAGLSTGIYAQLNGYESKIFELHSLPGGLMTAWKRKGYTIDGCIHWLTGSRQGSQFYKMWEEIGLIQNREIYNPEIFTRFEDKDGKVVILYSDTNRLEKHLLEIAPEDKKVIRGMCSAIRTFSRYNPLPDDTWLNRVKNFWMMLQAMPKLIQWTPKTTRDLGELFTNPTLRKYFSTQWMPEMSSVALLMTLGWLNTSMAGYPIGGSFPMAMAVEKRYKDLGGKIFYNAKVAKIIVENHKAVGIRFVDGTEEFADVVISAADGHATLFTMLDGNYIPPQFDEMFSSAPIFPSILLIGLGVKRKFEEKELYGLTTGLVTELKEPVVIAGKSVNRLETMIYNFDPTLAPEGKTILTVMLETDYQYWRDLSTDREHYDAEKEQAALSVIRGLNQRFPGLADQVEMADVATPVTFERYTGNWKGSFEGWLPTPKAIQAKMPKTLEGLSNFYMVGQWVQPGGGLPSGVMTAQEVLKQMCKVDGKRFKTVSN